MSEILAFERWIRDQVSVLARSGQRLDDLLDAPELAAGAALGRDATYALGVIAGAAGTLDVTPRELLDQLDLWPRERVRLSRETAPGATRP
jgi:hypothetical protein